MAFSKGSAYFWEGFRSGTPFVFVALPFGILFGVFATEAGLNILQTMTFSATVLAGATQLTALQLMNEGTPVLIILFSALVVNMRVAIYSASLTPHMGAAPLWQRACVAYLIVDQSYACSIIQFEKEPKMSMGQRVGFFFGSVAPSTGVWLLSTYAGAVVGNQIPESWALDFALPLTIIAMLGPMIPTLPHLVAVLVAVITSLLTVFFPFNLGLLIAGCAGMIAGAQAEVLLKGR